MLSVTPAAVTSSSVYGIISVALPDKLVIAFPSALFGVISIADVPTNSIPGLSTARVGFVFVSSVPADESEVDNTPLGIFTCRDCVPLLISVSVIKPPDDGVMDCWFASIGVNPVIAFAKLGEIELELGTLSVTTIVVAVDSFPLSPTAFTDHVPLVRTRDAFGPLVTALSAETTTTFPSDFVAIIRDSPP